MKQILCAFALTGAFTAIALGQVAQAPQTHDMATPQKMEISLYPTTEIQWKDGPGSLSAGAKMAVLEGDPTKEGFFTMRLWFPDGFKVQPHWHPRVEHVTVISGTLNIGMGDKFDQAATRAMPDWDLWLLAPGNEAFRLGQGRHRNSASWNRAVGDYLPQPIG